MPGRNQAKNNANHRDFANCFFSQQIASSQTPVLSFGGTNGRRTYFHDGELDFRRVKKPEQLGRSGFCQLAGMPGTAAQAGRMPLVTR